MLGQSVPDEQTRGVSLRMTDPGVQIVREWLQRQPFSLRILTLIIFIEEAVNDEFGDEVMNSFDRDLKEAYRKLPRRTEKQKAN
jgi:hypothetical protein